MVETSVLFVVVFCVFSFNFNQPFLGGSSGFHSSQFFFFFFQGSAWRPLDCRYVFFGFERNRVWPLKLCNAQVWRYVCFFFGLSKIEIILGAVIWRADWVVYVARGLAELKMREIWLAKNCTRWMWHFVLNSYNSCMTTMVSFDQHMYLPRESAEIMDVLFFFFFFFLSLLNCSTAVTVVCLGLHWTDHLGQKGHHHHHHLIISLLGPGNTGPSKTNPTKISWQNIFTFSGFY